MTDRKVLLGSPIVQALSRGEQVALVNALTRRGFITAASGIIAAAAAARGVSAQDATPAATPVPGVWPRTIHGTFGDVELAAKPERIAAVSDWFEVDYLMAMGVRPILYGYTNRYELGVSPWLVAAGGDTLEHYDLTDAVDLERMVAATPDLIIADPFIAEEVVEPLQQIAPTVGIPTPYTGSEDWREAQRLVGQACGTEEAAELAIAETEAAVAAGREALAPFAGRAVTILYAFADANMIYGVEESSWVAKLIEQLGLQFVSRYDGSGQSVELIGEANDADILLSWDIWGGPAFLEGQPLFQAISAVQEGRYAVLSGATARAIFGPTTLSVRWAIAELVEKITLAANGEGRTIGA